MSRWKAVRPLTDLLLVFAGPVIWFGHFAFIYGAETLVCLGPAASADQRTLLIYALATIAALASLGFLARREARNTGFLPRACLVLTLLAILGVIWTTIPAAFLPLCAGPISHVKPVISYMRDNQCLARLALGASATRDVRFGLPAQLVDATQALNLSARVRAQKQQ